MHNLHFYLGYGFPATFGFVIAAIFGVITIQIFVLRDSKKTKKRVLSAGEPGQNEVA